MPAITVSYSNKVPTDWDPDAPITSAKLNALYDSIEFVKQGLFGGYMAGAVQNHNHDGVNSAAIKVGPNYLRNGSFDDDTAGWTITQYSGGTVVRDTVNALDGNASLSFTSTVLANGGGDATSNEYIAVSENHTYSLNGAVKASVANVSGKWEAIWYDKDKAQISMSTIYTSANLLTSGSIVGSFVTSPINARFMRVKITGGIPATGTAVGTVWFDGLKLADDVGNIASSGTTFFHTPVAAIPATPSNAVTTASTMTKYFELRVSRDGFYNIKHFFSAYTNAYAQIYRNGNPYGTLRNLNSVSATYNDVLWLSAGDFVQIYGYQTYGGGGYSEGYLQLGELNPPVVYQTMP